MINLFKKRQTYSDYAFIAYDFHSHVLPGIDDGAVSMDESVELIRHMKGKGFDKITATPHIKSGSYLNNIESILRCSDEVKMALEEADIDIDFDAAAEYFCDDYFMKLLKAGEILTFGDNHILFEFSFYQPPLNPEQIIYEIQMAGYKPILAHPERYMYYRDNDEIFPRLKEAGCLLQANILSYSGYYGEGIRKHLKDLINAELIDFLCSDIHRPFQLPVMEKALTQIVKYPFKNSILATR